MNAINYVFKTAYNTVIGVPTGIGEAVIHAAATVTGVAGSALSLITLGKSETVNSVANLAVHSTGIIPVLYTSAIHVINPNAEFSDKFKAGVLTDSIAGPFFSKAVQLTFSRNFIVREIFSRLSFAVTLVAAAVTRVADFAIGVVAAALSIIPCFGRVKAVNDFAVRQLSSVGLVSDICFCVRAIENPHQLIRPDKIIREEDSDIQPVEV